MYATNFGYSAVARFVSAAGPEIAKDRVRESSWRGTARSQHSVTCRPSDNWLTPDGATCIRFTGTPQLVGVRHRSDGSLKEIASVAILCSSRRAWRDSDCTRGRRAVVGRGAQQSVGSCRVVLKGSEQGIRSWMLFNALPLRVYSRRWETEASTRPCSSHGGWVAGGDRSTPT